MAAIKIHYFQLITGRAGPIISLCKAAKQPYEFHPVGNWAEEKSKYAFGQVPAVEMDGEVLVQSTAIMCKLGIKFGFYSKDPFEVYLIHWWIDAMEDVIGRYSAYAYGPMDEAKQKKKEDFFAEFYPLYLKQFEKKINLQENKNFLIGGRLTIADFVIVGIFEMFLTHSVYGSDFQEGIEKYAPILCKYVEEEREKYYPKMKAIVRYKDGNKLTELKKVIRPILAVDHAIIKTVASPINPIDDYFYHGWFPYPNPIANSVICGTEGAGIIEEVGPGVSKELIGKKVAFHSSMFPSAPTRGCWSQYAQIHKDGLIILDDSVKLEEASGCFVNPLTALGFIHTMQSKGYKAAIHTAAASALGKIFLKLAIENGIDLICVVRRDEQISDLKKLGGKYVLNQNSEGFEDSLKELAEKLGARCCWEAIGGEMTGRILNLMPSHSVVYVYGSLSNQPVSGVAALALMAQQKKLKGYILYDAPFVKDPEKKKKILAEIAHSLTTKDTYKITVAREVKLEDHIKEVKESGWATTASKGKTIIKFT